MAHDVFVSYSSKDKSTADAVCARLEADGVRCWIAPRDILPGAEWGEAIMAAIEGCRVMVLIFSQHANASPQVRREVERAIHRGVHVVPLRIEDLKPTGSMEYFISTPHWLDALTPPIEQHLDKIANSVKAALGAAPTTDDPPAPPPAPRKRWPLVVLAAAVVVAVAFWALRDDGIPRLASSEPANGAEPVPLNVGVVVLRFDRDMRDSYTLWESNEGMFPNLVKGTEPVWRDQRTLEFRIQPLDRHTVYAIQLNAEERQGFKSTDGTPLPVTTIIFRTSN